MKKLRNSQLNTAEEYDRIFLESEPNWQDFRRWHYLAKYLKEGMQVLDVGCLFSGIDEIVLKKFKNVWYTGTDISPGVINHKQINNRHPGTIDYMLDDISDSRLSKEQFDYVIMGELLEHMENPLEVIRKGMELLRIGGILALSAPLNETEAGEVDKERHLWSFSKNDILEALSIYGKVEIKILRSKWFPFYKYSFPTIVAWCKKQ